MTFDQFVQWALAQKVPLLYNTKDPTLRGQCVQLVCFYVTKVWKRPVIWANAKDWMNDKLSPSDYTRIKYDGKNRPPKGAVVIFGSNTPGSGGYGHIAIVLSAPANSQTFVSLDANWGGKLPHKVTHNYQYVVGWLIPKLPNQAVSAPTSKGADEMITTADQANKMYGLLRPNKKASDAEIKATVGKRTFASFLNDAQKEVSIRDANFTKEATEFAKMQANINNLNKTITDLRTSQTVDAEARAEEQRAAQEKISFLTSQLEQNHDNITDLQNEATTPPPTPPKEPKTNWLTLALSAIFSKKK